jgi:hypothetical protein
MYAESNAVVGSNGEIKMSGNSGVHGNATTSSPGGLDVGGGWVTGDTTSTDAVVNLDPVDGGDIAWAESHNSAPGGLSFFGSANYDVASKALTSSGGGKVTFNSGTYYFSSVNLSGGSVMEIAPGAVVKIYVTGEWKTSGGGMVNTDGIPGNVQIYSTGTKFEFSGGSGFWAGVYAPNAKIVVSGGGNAYGSFIGNEIVNSGGTIFHQDEALMSNGSGGIESYKLIAWRQL